LDALRKAEGRPVTAAEIVTRILAAKGLADEPRFYRRPSLKRGTFSATFLLGGFCRNETILGNCGRGSCAVGAKRWARLLKIHSVNSPVYHNAPVIVSTVHTNSAVRPDAAGMIDATRTNDCVSSIRNKSGENESDQQSRNEKLH